MRNLNWLDKYRRTDKELEIAGCKGDEGNGVFEIRIGAKWFYVIATNGGGWEHVSVSPSSGKGIPTWNDMYAIKKLFFDDEETVVQYHPKKGDYVNIYNKCLHLWRPINQEMPMPPKGVM